MAKILWKQENWMYQSINVRLRGKTAFVYFSFTFQLNRMHNLFTQPAFTEFH